MLGEDLADAGLVVDDENLGAPRAFTQVLGQRDAVLAHESDQILASDAAVPSRGAEGGQASGVDPVDDRQRRDVAQLGRLEGCEYGLPTHRTSP